MCFPITRFDYTCDNITITKYVNNYYVFIIIFAVVSSINIQHQQRQFLCYFFIMDSEFSDSSDDIDTEQRTYYKKNVKMDRDRDVLKKIAVKFKDILWPLIKIIFFQQEKYRSMIIIKIYWEKTLRSIFFYIIFFFMIIIKVFNFISITFQS